MGLLAPARSSRMELLDLPGAHSVELPANLRDIRVLNRWFGGTSLMLKALDPWLHGRTETALLDVATGSADIPVAAFVHGVRRGINMRVTGLDAREDVLAEAQNVVGDLPIALVPGDARALPFADSAFDVVTCCLALHHFEPVDAVRVLSEMGRVASRAVIITDLRRSYVGYAGVWLVTRTVARNRLTRNDGPLSVLRAYSPREMATLLAAAGFHDCSVRRYPFFRQAAVANLGVANA